MASAASAVNGVAFVALCVMLVLSSLGQELPKASLCCSNSCASCCNSSCTAAANQTCTIQLPIAQQECYSSCNDTCTANCGTRCGYNATCTASCNCDAVCRQSCSGLTRYDVGCNMYAPDTIFLWCWPTCNATCYDYCVKG